MDIFSTLSFDEGLRLKLYTDTLGYWTVGIGHLVTKNKSYDVAVSELDKLVKRSTKGVITQKEAKIIFEADIQIAINTIKANSFLSPIYNNLDINRQTGLINMAFQLGTAGVARFTNSLALLKAKQYDSAAKNFRLSKWYKQTPNRAERVINTLCYGSFKLYGVK